MESRAAGHGSGGDARCDRLLSGPGASGRAPRRLRTCPTPLLLLTAVDCPFLTPALADGLLAAIGTADASVYTLDGRPQPLFGLYRRTCLPEAAGMLAVGENKLRLLLDRVDTVYLPTADRIRSAT